MKISKILKEYLHIHTDEKPELDRLITLLQETSNPLSRKNFTGHITASAFIVNEASKQVLLLEHKSLGRLLQPGGHVEASDDTLLDSVYREVEEETGLKANDLKLKPLVPSEIEVPIDIDSHIIPANLKKNEPEHYHHDFRYLFQAHNTPAVRLWDAWPSRHRLVPGVSFPLP